MKLTFLGAAETVTGSKYLLENAGKQYLIDCGLFQGPKELRKRNWDPFPVDPKGIDGLILTHAHIDHTGYIPLLVKQGFTGKIYCTEATLDLCSILLPDSGYIQEEDARRANRFGYSKHKPALPLYDKEDALRSLENFQAVEFGERVTLDDEHHVIYTRAGHILGAASLQFTAGLDTIAFSGDIGRLHDPVMKSPATIQEADYLLIESTYGDRLHNKVDPSEEIAEVISSTAAKGGTVVIPSFAVGRSQSILYYIHKLKKEGSIPDIPVFLDSPMAINATKLLNKHAEDHRLPRALCKEVCAGATYTRTVEESKAIKELASPSVVISASGMATGGRVLHHLKHFMTDAKNTILFTGYQAPGTRGGRIAAGEKEIRIHGEMFPLKARVESLDNTSAHADYDEILEWLGGFRSPPRRTFIVHGDPEATASMKRKIENKLGWNVEIPEYRESVDL